MDDHPSRTLSECTTTTAGPALLTKASDSIFNRSTFNAVGGDQHNTIISQSVGKEKYLATLKPVNRDGHYVQPCMKGTRQDIFETVDEWLGNVNEPNILWLHGSPGSGKSTLASSLVSKFMENGCLGSSFFFKRGDATLSDPTAVWRTVAHDLARRDDSFAENLVAVLKGRSVNPGWPDIALQFRHLVKEPLIRSSPNTPPIIVIDALDECGVDDSQAAQRRMFIDTIIQWSTLPGQYKLIVTGRNDRMPDKFHTCCKQVTLPTGLEVNENANADIRHFFKVRLAEFGDRLGPELQGEPVLDDLTIRAAGLFIWAETVVRFVDEGLYAEQLKLVLSGSMGGGDDMTKLYRQILEVAFRKANKALLEAFNGVVAAIVLAKVPFQEDDLPQFSGQPKTSVKFILNKLSSVISIGNDKRCRFSHLSFPEFLCDSTQCPEQFYIGRREESRKLSMTCFRLMRDGLRFNICDLETSSLLNTEVGGLPERVRAKVPGALSYSCRFWSPHFQDTMTNEHDEAVMAQVKEFFDVRFFYWLEVMSLTNEVTAANIALLTIAPLIAAFDKNLSDFVRDASRFIVNFYTPISKSTPHIYVSALPFSPTNCLVWQYYKRSFSNTLSLLCGREDNWPASINMFQGHTDYVTSVAFSPDGTRVASGSRDKTVRIWDAQTGHVIAGPFEGHTNDVNSVTFSPDGTRVASGSNDNTIVWDAQTGQIVEGPCEAHTAWVTSVAFSPDGTQVASGSHDNTIRVWDVHRGQVIAGPFEGHTDSATSVAFSPDGKRVASGSNDNTIRIWDVQSGRLVAGPFEAHTSSVYSVTFSPDGTRVASGSGDTTIRIWNAQTGLVIAGPFKGHTFSVTSVAFSPDGTRVGSGSYDNTIRIWDATTGQVIAGPFEGHTENVSSVVFSPDGTRVASGSYDKTIRIWDAQTGQMVRSPCDGHTDSVNSVVLSPDGTRVASGSRDKTIRIWDVWTGQVITGPLKGHISSVSSVAFSPDGKQVASGSYDKTIRIWDAQTGQAIAGPFKGHTKNVNSIVFSPDGTRIASGSNDNTIRIWGVLSGHLVAGPFEAYTSSVYSVAFSPDGTRVASGYGDKTIRIWDAQTGLIIAGPFEGHTDGVTSVAFSPGGTRVASGSYDETIRIWDAQTGQAIGLPFEGHTAGVSSVAFSPDGKRVVSGSEDKTICIWDMQTGQVVAGPFEGHTDWVNSVVFSPDGLRVVSGSWDRTIRVWGSQTRPLEIHKDTVRPVTSDDTHFVYGSDNSTIHVDPIYSPNLHLRHHMDKISLIGGARTLNYFRDSFYHRDTASRGWVRSLDQGPVDNASILFFVPPLCRQGLCAMDTLLIFGQRTTRVDLGNFAYGESWAQCYSGTATESSLPSPPSDHIKAENSIAVSSLPLPTQYTHSVSDSRQPESRPRTQ